MFRHAFLALAIFSASLPLRAESLYDRELQQLTEQRDKALANAALPINRNYQAALEQLLARATRNKDLDASAKIVAALRSIGAAPVAPEIKPPTMPLKAQIEELLSSRVWVHRGQYHYKFTKEGRVQILEMDRKGKYQIDEKSGFVTFTWEKNQFAGEGIQFDRASGNFVHNKGDPLVPAP